MALKIDEKNLEDIIFSEMLTVEGCRRLKERGLVVGDHKHYNVFRQVNLKDYGIADIIKVTFEQRYIFINVIELKVEPFNINQLYQIGRYISCINNIISGSKQLAFWRFCIRGTLIVSSFNPDGACWLYDLLQDINVYTTEYNINGITWNPVFNNRWYKKGVVHSVENFFDLQRFKPAFKDSYREFMEINQSKQKANG